jgi:hypothetical protein
MFFVAGKTTAAAWWRATLWRGDVWSGKKISENKNSPISFLNQASHAMRAVRA